MGVCEKEQGGTTATSIQGAIQGTMVEAVLPGRSTAGDKRTHAMTGTATGCAADWIIWGGKWQGQNFRGKGGLSEEGVPRRPGRTRRRYHPGRDEQRVGAEAAAEQQINRESG